MMLCAHGEVLMINKVGRDHIRRVHFERWDLSEGTEELVRNDKQGFSETCRRTNESLLRR